MDPALIQNLTPIVDALRPFANQWGPPIVAVFLARYINGSEETARLVAQRTEHVLNSLGSRIQLIIDEGRVSEHTVRLRFQDPEYLMPFQDGLLRAAETSDSYSHEEFAALIAERLSTTPGSRKSLMLRLAAERSYLVTGRQLKILALLVATRFRIAPSNLEDKSALLASARQFDESLGIFDDIEPDNYDYLQLVDGGLLAAPPHTSVGSPFMDAFSPQSRDRPT